jgi:predicted dinucleotide-binding enzyme
MHVGIIGSGTVAQTLGTKLAELGHRVTISSRDTSAAKEKPWGSLPSADAWVEEGRRRGLAVEAASFSGAASRNELIINATEGIHSLQALARAGRPDLAGKILVDVANPLLHSAAGPPRLAFCNESLGEQIQEAFPDTRVVKTLNTVNANVMVDPGSLGGPSDLFIAGNDADAKEQVRRDLLEGAFGWTSVIDLGDIRAARATETYLQLWIQLWQVMGGAGFNIRVVGAA